MNDRFKTRIWHTPTKEFLFVLNLGEDFTQGTPSLVVTSCRTIRTKDYVLEQCTGLKDASGNLIYEGDLLLLDPDDPPALVVWNKDVAMFCLEQEDCSYTFDNCGYTPREMEIIGNIHENPDLLKENNK